MKILVTGVTGFIGRHLIRSLAELGNNELITVSRTVPNNLTESHHHITCDMGDTNCDTFEKTCEHYKPEVIFHLASNAVPNLENKNPYSMIQDNIISTHKVVESAPKGCRVVLISSVTVYGDWLFNNYKTRGLKCKESYFTKPTSVYGMTKRASESLIEIYTAMGKINGCCLRLCATIGGGLTHGIIKDFIAKLQSPSPSLEALGKCPGSTKPFCHVDDAVSAMILMMNNDTNSRFNVCPDDELSVSEIAGIVMRACGIIKTVKWLGDKANWKGDNKIIRVYNHKIKQIGWKPKYPRSEDAIIAAVKESLC